MLPDSVSSSPPSAAGLKVLNLLCCNGILGAARPRGMADVNGRQLLRCSLRTGSWLQPGCTRVLTTDIMAAWSLRR